MSTTESWRDAPTCPDHDEYENDCEACFAEAVEGGLSWLVDQALRGTVAIEMPAAAPFHRVFEITFEGIRLFAVTYKQGDALVLPVNADDRIAELLDANQKNVEFWDDRIRDAERKIEESWDGAPSKDLENTLHRAMKSRGVAGARLDRVEHWTRPLITPRGVER